MKKLFAKPQRPAIALLLMLPVAGCGTTTGTAAIDGGCRAFTPISWSAGDTDATISEVKAHNAAWKAVCGGK